MVPSTSAGVEVFIVTGGISVEYCMVVLIAWFGTNRIQEPEKCHFIFPFTPNTSYLVTNNTVFSRKDGACRASLATDALKPQGITSKDGSVVLRLSPAELALYSN